MDVSLCWRVACDRPFDSGYPRMAERLGAAHLEQADLALSRSGEVIFVVTPIRPGSDPRHRGGVVYTV